MQSVRAGRPVLGVASWLISAIAALCLTSDEHLALPVGCSNGSKGMPLPLLPAPLASQVAGNPHVRAAGCSIRLRALTHSAVISGNHVHTSEQCLHELQHLLLAVRAPPAIANALQGAGSKGDAVARARKVQLGAPTVMPKLAEVEPGQLAPVWLNVSVRRYHKAVTQPGRDDGQVPGPSIAAVRRVTQADAAD